MADWNPAQEARTRSGPAGAVRRACAPLAVALSLAGCADDAGTLPERIVASAKAVACRVVGDCDPPRARAGDRRERPPRTHLVELAEVRTGSLRISSTHTGSLRSRRTVRVFNQEEGRVTSLPFYEGDRVAAADVLLELDSTLLRAQLDRAVAVRKDAETSLARVMKLERGNLVAEDEISRAGTAVEVARAEERVLRARVGYTVVRAPFAGVVTARLVEVGDIVPRHSHVLTVSDPSALVTDIMVSELLAPHLEVDGVVDVRIDALGDRIFTGAILRIHPDLDARTRQGRVEVVLDPVPDGARAGQFARVTFATEALDRKHLPFSALRRDRDGEYVFTVDESLEAARTPVRSGRRLADRVEILEGLEVGQRVVVKGFLGLASGTTVEPVGERAAPEGAPSGERAS